MRKQPAVYLLTNKPNGTLYTGVTSDLIRRMWQHKNKAMKGFSARYNLNRLVYVELFENMYEAISREKQRSNSSSVIILSGKIFTQRRVSDGDCRVASLLAMTRVSRFTSSRRKPGSRPLLCSGTWIPAYAGMTGLLGYSV